MYTKSKKRGQLTSTARSRAKFKQSFLLKNSNFPAFSSFFPSRTSAASTFFYPFRNRQKERSNVGIIFQKRRQPSAIADANPNSSRLGWKIGLKLWYLAKWAGSSLEANGVGTRCANAKGHLSCHIDSAGNGNFGRRMREIKLRSE